MRITTILAAAAVSLSACASFDGSRGITAAYVEGDRVIVETVSGRIGDFPKYRMCTWAHINIDQEESYRLRANRDSTERSILGVTIEGLDCPFVKPREGSGGGGVRQTDFVEDTNPTNDQPSRGQQ